MRKAEFTREERDKIRALLREKATSDAAHQKVVRAKLRALGFRITDWSSSNAGFTEADFDSLISSGRIRIKLDLSNLSSDIDLSILYENAERPEASPEGGDHSPFSQPWLRTRGFAGFRPFSDLMRAGFDDIPPRPGVYVVVRAEQASPVFLATSVGGHFKGMDPTVDIRTLEASWLDECACLYIGKGEDLRRRIREYARYGSGKPIGHRGGRYIWQLEGSSDLLVAWLETSQESAREISAR
jgi:hypothetical protein